MAVPAPAPIPSPTPAQVAAFQAWFRDAQALAILQNQLAALTAAESEAMTKLREAIAPAK